ncbi:hypothetical protein CFP65_5541 [Kitasatospora sp. MMS16-BH015]|uniref:hypothetical protein n=1 Tax=Kitasatospora sp. MMS16-BH015 TaxID=2018025 RepID=UPI000CA3C40B|nr:hypothetical protein [Kitasatospora sp. MMS16-BH015]AUG80238.1 hypothetical protein CFP65_5541 [Kitasatospora sp. MMS16-BH015]
MRLTKNMRRVAAVAFAAAALVGAAATSASATEGTWTISSGSSCVALEKIQLQGGHDYIAVDPIANAGGCSFGVWNVNAGSWAYGPTSSGAQSPWIYDGPGQLLQACVFGPNGGSCGPAN